MLFPNISEGEQEYCHFYKVPSVDDPVPDVMDPPDVGKDMGWYQAASSHPTCVPFTNQIQMGNPGLAMLTSIYSFPFTCDRGTSEAACQRNYNKSGASVAIVHGKGSAVVAITVRVLILSMWLGQVLNGGLWSPRSRLLTVRNS